ncbi:hypothetical protein [Streptomyces sp. NPDC086023]|uniref:hypothetical protein n=1 Tax=Streptomyces sp. NPDC086023 TaxID=3365746 RepID=UPI0037D539BE
MVDPLYFVDLTITAVVHIVKGTKREGVPPGTGGNIWARGAERGEGDVWLAVQASLGARSALTRRDILKGPENTKGKKNDLLALFNV